LSAFAGLSVAVAGLVLVVIWHGLFAFYFIGFGLFIPTSWYVSGDDRALDTD
jgi:hypothetical protein